MICRRCRCMLPRAALILALLSSQVLAFLRPPACSFSTLHHAPKAQSTAPSRLAAVAGGSSDGKINTGTAKSSAESQRDTVPSALPSPPVLKSNEPDSTAHPVPSGQKQRGLSRKIAPGAVAKDANSDVSSAGTKADSVTLSAEPDNGMVVAGETLGQAAATDSVRRDARPFSSARGKKAPAAKAVGKGGKGRAVGTKPVESPAANGKGGVGAASDEEAMLVAEAAKVAAARKKFKNTDVVAAAPETTAAEKVLSLLDLGLVDEDEVAAYYEALSDLERTTREAKEAAARSPVTSSTSKPSTPQQNPASLVPFPVLCAALGAAGAHSLQLTGDLDTAASACGGIAGATLGGLLVVGDDPVGRTARALGAGIAGQVGAAGDLAGKSVSESAAGAAGAAVAAVEEAVIKAPASLAEGVMRSVSETLSEGARSIVNLPEMLAKKAVDEAKGVLQETSEAAFSLPGEIVRKVSDAAGGALKNTSEATITAVKESPKEAAKRLKEAISAPGDALKEAVASPEKVLGSVASFVSRTPDAGSGGNTVRGKAILLVSLENRWHGATQLTPVRPTVAAEPARKRVSATSVDRDEEELEGVPVEELEAKMSLVQEALERFDAVKDRIARAQTSGALLETVGMTRSIDLTAERERGEKGRAAAKLQRERRTDAADDVRRRTSPARSVTSKEKEPVDEDRRKRVAEDLLEKASQRAAEAKAGLKAAAASARRKAETGSTNDGASAATTTGKAPRPEPQVVVVVGGGGAASG